MHVIRLKVDTMKKLPIGISDFKKLVAGNYYYVDKTLLIKELVDSSGDVLLIPRPRRFGKTLNLSMLHYFFEKTAADNSILFAHTAIWQQENYKKLQGKYPVIFLTFKDIKEADWEIAYKRMISIIAKEFERHFAAVKEHLSGHQLIEYETIIAKTADQAAYHESLLLLTEFLYKAYNEKVIVLLDEYDAPIHAGYSNEYYEQSINFMRPLLTSVFKDNKYLERGVLTGILRTAKEGIFSGLNNLDVCTLLENTFQDKFGFTQPEVNQILADYNYSGQIHEVQQWYNGYIFGSTTIYNPWSILMFVHKEGKLQPYWVNTSDNKIIKKLLTYSDIGVKTDIESLLIGNTITKIIDEAVIFPGIEHNEQALWSLFLFTGYLTFASCNLERGKLYCNLKIPNEEIKILYETFIQDIVQELLKTEKVTTFLHALVTGDKETFAALLQEFIINSMSFYDLPSGEPEKSYHLFVLGLLVYLSDTYQVKSNRESGFGRYDIMLIPKNKNKLGIIMELKKVSAHTNETLELAAQRALEQISTKHYVQEMKSLGITKIKAFGIAFEGKKVLVLDQDLN